MDQSIVYQNHIFNIEDANTKVSQIENSMNKLLCFLTFGTKKFPERTIIQGR